MTTLAARTVSTHLAVLGIALLLPCVFGANSVSAATGLAGAVAPDFVLKSLSGANVRLSEYRGDVVLVNFWATWCGECRSQLVDFNEWQATYEGAGLRLLAVNLDRRWTDMSKTAVALELNYPVLHDAALQVSELYEVSAMPASVLIDRDGIVREVIEGYGHRQTADVLERVRALLRE
jgi:peroxiredoxin